MKEGEYMNLIAVDPMVVDPCGCVVSMVDGQRVVVGRCPQNMAIDLPGVFVTEDGALAGVAI